MKKMTKIGLAGIVSTLVFAVPAMAKTPAKPAAKPTVKAVAAKTSAKASDKTAAKATTKTAAKVDKSAKMQASSKKVVKGSAAEKTQKNQTLMQQTWNSARLLFKSFILQEKHHDISDQSRLFAERLKKTAELHFRRRTAK